MPQQVILVPGITANTLVTPARQGKAKKVWWFNPANLALAGPGVLQLAPDGVSPGALVPLSAVPIVPEDLSVFAPYGNLLNWLGINGYSPAFWNFDWRQDIIRLGQQFGLFMAQRPNQGPFSVIGHSMGGLIARLAYATYVANAPRNQWESTIYVAVPHWGSFEAARALTGVQSYYSLLYTFFLLGARLANPLSIFPGITSTGAGSVGDNMLSTVASWPGLYGLLPVAAYGPLPRNPKNALLLQASFYAGVNPHVDQPHLDAAVAVQNALQAALTAPRPLERNVIANGYVTNTDLVNPAAPTAQSSWDYSADGDGAVTISRQQLAAISQYTVTSAHYTAADSGAFIQLLPDLLLPATTVASPKPQLAPPIPVSPPPVKGTIIFQLPPQQVGAQVKNDP